MLADNDESMGPDPVDTTAPTVVSITSGATHPTKDSFTVTITFSEEVTGLTAGEIAVINGTGSNLAGTGASYTLNIEPNPNIEDDLTVRVPTNAAVDSANNGNVQGSETFAVDTRAPALLSAAVNGADLMLNYGEALARSSTPGVGDSIPPLWSRPHYIVKCIIDGKAKTHAPTKRLSIDVPVFVHRRFKTACRATSRQMVAELRHLIEARMVELESEIGGGEAG